MKRKAWLILGIFVVIIILLTSCEYKQIQPVDKEKSEDYFVFGHTQAFCMSCDVVCKIEDGKLYGVINQVVGDPDSVMMVLLPDNLYEKVKDLPAQLPSQIFPETSERIGSYWPDAGHYYIKLKASGKERHWFIEAGDNPTYLKGFVAELSKAIYELRQK
jgi:hypothetical protein